MDDDFGESLVYSESDNSDDEVGAKLDTHLSPSEKPTHNESVSKQGSEESDEDDMNISIVKSRKNARILSSDDEKESCNNESHMDDKNTTASRGAINVRPSICDSDTKTSSDENQSDIKPLKKLKKRKLKQRNKSITNQSDSESDDSSENKKKNHKTNNGKLNSSSGDSSSSDNQIIDASNVKPREKPVQRVIIIIQDKISSQPIYKNDFHLPND